MAGKSHGMSRTRQYSIWYDMKRRCRDPRTITFKSYGLLGITYDPSWESFEGFWKDMGADYDENLTLDRIDPLSNYCKENCQWITSLDQKKNKRMYKTNKLGVAGCCIYSYRNEFSLRVRISDHTSGKRFIKSYSLNKYSLEDALVMAEEWREEMKVKLGYGENHGCVYDP